MTDFYSQNRCVCSTRSHGPLLCAFCLSFHFKSTILLMLESEAFFGDCTRLSVVFVYPVIGPLHSLNSNSADRGSLRRRPASVRLSAAICSLLAVARRACHDRAVWRLLVLLYAVGVHRRDIFVTRFCDTGCIVGDISAIFHR